MMPTTKRGRGRPPTTGRGAKDASATLIRWSAEERALLDEAVPTDQAAWARGVLLEAARVLIRTR